MQAKESFDRADYAKARDLFQRAYTLVPAPTLALYEARALGKLGRLVEAEEAYMRAVRTRTDGNSPDQFRKAVGDAEIELVDLRPRIPKLTLVATGPGSQDPGASITLDGKPFPRALLGVETPIDPGEHELSAAAPGGKRVTSKVSIAEREHKNVVLDLPAGSDPQPELAAAPRLVPQPLALPLAPSTTPATSSFLRPAAFAAGGVGVVGLATGMLAGVMASSRHTDAERLCPEQVCLDGSEGADAVRSFRSLRTVSTVGYVVGIVGVAAGVTLYLTAPSQKPGHLSASLRLSGPGLDVGGSF
jgi:hypothetical protein